MSGDEFDTTTDVTAIDERYARRWMLPTLDISGVVLYEGTIGVAGATQRQMSSTNFLDFNEGVQDSRTLSSSHTIWSVLP
jgi:hypothetical protein